MKKLLVLIIIAAIGAAIAWKVLATEVDADASG
jgi:hypothetical protein